MKKSHIEMLDTNLTAEVASATECTGLMQVPPEDAEDYEAYTELYTTEVSKAMHKKE